MRHLSNVRHRDFLALQAIFLSVSGLAACEESASWVRASPLLPFIFVLMRELKLREALTTDQHFLQAGFGIKPG